MKWTTKSGVNYYLGKRRYKHRHLSRDDFWYSIWKPAWHNGRGHYITIGFLWWTFMRGY